MTSGDRRPFAAVSRSRHNGADRFVQPTRSACSFRPHGDAMERVRRFRIGLAALTAALILLWASAAAGQSQGGVLGPPLLTSSILGTVAVGSGGAITTLMVTSDRGDGESKEAFLRRHRFALRRGIAVGGGLGVAVLADAFDIDRPARSAFGRMLRERRDELLPLVRTEAIDREAAEAFFRRVRGGLRSHPTLRDEWLEFRETRP